MREVLKMAKETFSPLYPPEGGPLSGFACCQCKGVTRTQAGMIRHLAICHGIRLQRSLDYEQSKHPQAKLPEGAPVLEAQHPDL